MKFTDLSYLTAQQSLNFAKNFTRLRIVSFSVSDQNSRISYLTAYIDSDLGEKSEFQRLISKFSFIIFNCTVDSAFRTEFD